jgi:hypothetical protein
VIGYSPQQRLNSLNAATDAGELAGCFAVGLLVLAASRSSFSIGALSKTIWSNWAWNRAWFSSQSATNSTSVSSVASSASIASSRHRCRPPGSGSDHPSSVSTALKPRAASSWTTLDFPRPRHASHQDPLHGLSVRARIRAVSR